MRIYRIPVEWTMVGDVEVEANSLSEAIELAYDSDLPGEGEFLDGSFLVQEDFIEDEEDEG